MVRVLAMIAPSAVAAAVCAVGWGLANSSLVDNNSHSATPFSLHAGDSGYLASLAARRIRLPAPEISPDEVVKTQLAGLADPRDDGLGILQCFVFASPGNRAATGPLDRFGVMVRQGPFKILAEPRAVLVGAPHVEGLVAVVLVTVADSRGLVQAFTFVLSKQTSPPFRDCWMTEAVFPSAMLGGPATQDDATFRPDAA